MAVRPLCTESHRLLRTPACPVEAFTEELRALACDLIETMNAHEGIGLAAPQIGQATQMFVANPSRARGRELVVVNPIVEAVKGRVTVTEGCLSLPNVWGRVRRAARVRLKGQDPHGQGVDLEADGLLAIILQHELDHLHGTLFIDRLSWLQRRRVRARLACA